MGTRCLAFCLLSSFGMASHIFTIGHSNHPLQRFLTLLAEHGIELLADIRRFPGSRKFPQFGQESLEQALTDAAVDYRWFESLGGRRSKIKGATSRNPGLRNDSFRNYADYMLTGEFRNGVAELLSAGNKKAMSLMCSE